jgi:hypothetical protein
MEASWNWVPVSPGCHALRGVGDEFLGHFVRPSWSSLTTSSLDIDTNVQAVIVNISMWIS